MKWQIRKKLQTDFLTGLVVVLPLAVTIWVIWLLIREIIDFSVLIMPYQIERYVEGIKMARAILAIFVLLLGAVVITMVGSVARNVVGKKLIDLGEKLIQRIPLVKMIYNTVQKISQVFVGQKLKVFQRVVLCQYPCPDSYSVGFVTSRIEKGIPGEDNQPYLNVFVPTTPNPTSGFLLVLPEKDTIPLDISVEDAIRFIVSAGTVPPQSKIWMNE